jgi:hypothetical protein
MTQADAAPAPDEGSNERLSIVVGMLQRFTWQRTNPRPDVLRIELGGRITLDDSAALWKRISETLAAPGDVISAEIDLSQIANPRGSPALPTSAQLHPALPTRSFKPMPPSPISAVSSTP